MENEPQPRMHDDCERCGSGYFITKFNARLYTFTKQPEIIILDAECTTCGEQKGGFMMEYIRDLSRLAGISETIEEWASVELHGEYLKYVEAELPVEHPITPRQEKPIAWLGYLLAHDLIDFSIEGEIII